MTNLRQELTMTRGAFFVFVLALAGCSSETSRSNPRALDTSSGGITSQEISGSGGEISSSGSDGSDEAGSGSGAASGNSGADNSGGSAGAVDPGNSGGTPEVGGASGVGNQSGAAGSPLVTGGSGGFDQAGAGGFAGSAGGGQAGSPDGSGGNSTGGSAGSESDCLQCPVYENRAVMGDLVDILNDGCGGFVVCPRYCPELTTWYESEQICNSCPSLTLEQRNQICDDNGCGLWSNFHWLPECVEEDTVTCGCPGDSRYVDCDLSDHVCKGCFEVMNSTECDADPTFRFEWRCDQGWESSTFLNPNACQYDLLSELYCCSELV